MRAQARRIPHEEEEESAFVSMTDMTVGFLFIMMIFLAFFASQITSPDAVSRELHEQVVADRDFWRFESEKQQLTIERLEQEVAELRREKDRLLDERNDLRRQLAEIADLVARLRADLAQQRAQLAALEAEMERATERVASLESDIEQKDARIAELEAELARLRSVDPLEAYLARVAQTRREVLSQLRDAIREDFPNLQVELSEESDALRFQGEGLFASGNSNLTTDKRKIVAGLAKRLDEVLPCFTTGPQSRFRMDCNRHYVMIEAVQIEGHTDDVGTDRVNRNLSTARANSTFFAMTEAAPSLMQHWNLKQQPVLSVAAYGPDRPVTTNETPAGRATNRRIDLRFIMVTPRDTEAIATIKSALETLQQEAR